jgi:uncharacterized protein
MIYPRIIEKELKKYIDTPEIIVLTGMRQVGKTTLLRKIFDKIPSQSKVFLDLENPLTQKIFDETDYNNIPRSLEELGLKKGGKPYIFLDEIQAMPAVVKAIKYLFDHHGFKFFLTGSSSYYLKNLFPESLAGRKFVFRLDPLTFKEFLIFKGEKGNQFSKFSQKEKSKNRARHEKLKYFYEEYLKYGGFPKVVLEEDLAVKQKRLEDILKSYFEKDVKALAKFREMRLFRNLIFLLSARIGSKIDISRLASELGTSRETVYSYLAFLEDTYFISLVGPFTKSQDKLISKASKVYFCDTGVARMFSEIAEGPIFENAVFNNLKILGKVNYFQKKSGGEIDFVLEGKAGLEAKLTGISRDLAKTRGIADKIGLKESYVITKNFVNKTGFIPAMDL